MANVKNFSKPLPSSALLKVIFYQYSQYSASKDPNGLIKEVKSHEAKVLTIGIFFTIP